MVELRRLIQCLLMVGFALALAGCAEVQPWERGVLAKPQMQSDRQSLQRAARTHVQNSREAATGGDVAAGGGCGCY